MTFLEFLSNIPDIEAEWEAALQTHQLAGGPWPWARAAGPGQIWNKVSLRYLEFQVVTCVL